MKEAALAIKTKPTTLRDCRPLSRTPRSFQMMASFVFGIVLRESNLI
jgi:hypothetical protein